MKNTKEKKEMASKECADAGPPVQSFYKGEGKTISLDGLNVYETGKGKTALILFYDIFGWNETNQNVFKNINFIVCLLMSLHN